MKMDVRIYIYTCICTSAHEALWASLGPGQRSIYTEEFLQRGTFTHKNFDAERFYTEKSLHTETLTHRCLYGAQRLLHREPLHHVYTKKYKRIYTQKSLRAEIFTNKKNSTEKSLYRRIFTHKRFYTRSLYGQKMHWETFALPTSAFPSVHLCVSICPYCPKFNF